MKRERNIAAAPALLASVALACAALAGCSGGSNNTAKQIAPGQFVRDEPVELSRASLSNSSRCFIDSINAKKPTKNGAWTVKRDEELVISGWAVSKDGKDAVSPLFVRITGAVQTYYAVTAARSPRPDVNRELNLAPELNAGFELRAGIGQVEPGMYSIMIMQPAPTAIEGCERQATLIVN